jgi:BirA family biotin operon repressor/biotin-[acetyl-CoA-carboxylase] ligase
MQHLTDRDPRFNAELFQKNLKTHYMGRYLIYRHETTSTMDVARRELDEGAQSGTLIIAESQTKGRGRVNRTWSSKNSGNLYFTFILNLHDFKDLIKVNFATAVAVACSLEVHAQLKNIGIKWPNDVWVKGKKICGMLLDCDTVQDSFKVSMGVGINVHEDMTKTDDPIVSEATSCYNEMGDSTAISRELLLASFCNMFEMLMSEDFNKVLMSYKHYDILVGNEITIMPKKKEDTSSYYTAKAIGYSQFGNLMIRVNGEEKELVAEEVSIRL